VVETPISAPGLIVACLIEPSDMRFLEGMSCICLIGASVLSSAAVEEQMEDMPVLVADSDEPCRRHVPSASTCHVPPRAEASEELRSRESMPVDDRFDSSSSTFMAPLAFISELDTTAAGAIRSFMLSACIAISSGLRLGPHTEVALGGVITPWQPSLSLVRM